MKPESMTVAVVGLGYVGLPLAVEFGKKYSTIGFDLSTDKVMSYRSFRDPTGEVPEEELRAAKLLEVSADPAQRVNQLVEEYLMRQARGPLLADLGAAGAAPVGRREAHHRVVVLGTASPPPLLGIAVLTRIRNQQDLFRVVS